MGSDTHDCWRKQVGDLPEELKDAKVPAEAFLAFTELWRNVHALAVATDLHYNSMGYFRRDDFKVGRMCPFEPSLSPESNILR